MKKLINILFLLLAIVAYSQHNTTGELQTVKTNGLHKIKIPNKIRSFSNKDLRDFRIRDVNNNQVPYFITQAKTEVQASSFNEFKIIDKNISTDTSSAYIFENSKGQINQAVLHIANYKGFKYYNLLGSNNKKRWFGLVNNQYINNLNSSQNTSIYKPINFPLCTYKYLKIVFNDKNSLPVNILNIGNSTHKISTTAIEEIPVKTLQFSKLADQKKTRATIVFENPEIINTIKFSIKAPKFYKRNATIYFLITTEANHKKTIQRQVIKRFSLNSETPNEINLSNVFQKELFIEIENQDNPELEISNLQFFQKSLYAIADLKEGEAYTITTGDKTLNRPTYDITYFRNKVSDKLPILNISNVVHTIEKSEETATISFWQQPWFMWLAIGLATLLIGFVISGLVKDMKQEAS